MDRPRRFETGSEVVLINSSTSRLSIPRFTHGTVVEQDAERSSAGYDSKILWRLADGTKRETWVPSMFLMLESEFH